jgi:hypothetical protein
MQAAQQTNQMVLHSRKGSTSNNDVQVQGKVKKVYHQ